MENQVAFPENAPSVPAMPGSGLNLPLPGLGGALRFISDGLTQQTGRVGLLRMVVGETVSCVPCDEAAIYLVEQNTDELVLTAVAGVGPLSANFERLYPGQGTPGRHRSGRAAPGAAP